MDRPALSHDVDDVEALEGGDSQRDEQEDGRGGEQGPGDVPELVPGAGPVQGGGLVVVLADVLEAGQEDDHRIADDLPDGDAHQAPEGEAVVP